LFALPESGVGLEPVHQIIGRFERGAAMRGGGGGEDDRRAGRDRAASVDDKGSPCRACGLSGSQFEA